MTPAQALIFDMDGLLLDTEKLYMKATQTIVGEWGHTVTTEDYADWIGRHVSWDEILALYPMELTEPQWEARWAGEFQRLIDTELELCPGVREFLDTTARDFPKAVASSTRRQTIEHHLRRMQLFDRFDAIVSAHEVPRGKPHPDVFLEAARRLGVDPAACVVFEDSPHGVKGAKAAGMRAVAVPTEHTGHLAFEGADLRAACLTDVTPEWLAGRG